MTTPLATDTAGKATRASARGNSRLKLVRVATEIFCERGFQSTGLDEVLQRSGIPKGSFYHFFASKRDFGLAVIDNYAEYFSKKLARIFSDPETPPLVKLDVFAEEARRGMAKYQFRRGCLIGNISQELGALDSDFRIRLEGVLQSWEQHVASCLDDAVRAGDLPAGTDTRRFAEFFWIGWEGAILRAKLTQNTMPLDLFLQLFWGAIGRSSPPRLP